MCIRDRNGGRSTLQVCSVAPWNGFINWHCSLRYTPSFFFFGVVWLTKSCGFCSGILIRALIMLPQVETPKNVLKDLNDNGNSRRRSFTPKFFNNLFALRGHVNISSSTRDNEEVWILFRIYDWFKLYNCHCDVSQNIPLTPKHTRLSSIRQRFGRNLWDC